MTQKTRLEEVFNLPPIEEFETIEEDETEVVEFNETVEIQRVMDEADKIDRALTPVTQVESTDEDMDSYAIKAMEAFEDIMDMGNNVSDNNCAEVYNAAARMMKNALEAKRTKMERKLKVVQLQLQKERLELEREKTDHKIAMDAKRNKDDASPDELTGEGHIIADRNDLLKQILEAQQGNKDTE